MSTEKLSDNLRVLSAAMVEKAKSGHPGGAMGGADFVSVLFAKHLRFDPENPQWVNRDRFFLDPGHMSPMLYSILAAYDLFTLNELQQFRQWDSVTPGHPERNIARGIENTSGPLGQGHSMAVGAAIAEKFLAERFGSWMEHKIYAFISDGGVQEEISQGAGRIAGNLGLDNLILFFDSNDVQLSTKTDAVTIEDTAAKYKAWGWHVIDIDGNDHVAIDKALTAAKQIKGQPTLIIGKTIMGKGAVDADKKSFEGQVSTHGQPLSKSGASFEYTIENLGGNAQQPFVIFDEVKSFIAANKQEKTREVKERMAEEKEWRKNNKDAAQQWDNFQTRKLADIDYTQIEVAANTATRNSAGSVLASLGEHIPNLVVASADLANSDKTDSFLKTTHAFKKGDFSGKFLQAGVSELSMGAIMLGMSLHGGVIPACGTFFVFSDYMKPVARLAALMEMPIIFIWTHDAFRVGEDGPTHQPVEQEAQIRLMEKLQNHSKKNSMLVLRPADGFESVAAWKMAVENANSPTALILSRQNVTDLADRSIEQQLDATAKGAYVVKDCAGTPDVIFVANGSEVSTMYAGMKLFEQETGKKVRLVSAISEGLFRSQSKDYQEKTLPVSVPKLGLTAGLSVTLEGLVGHNGFVIGMNSFGFSAPADVLDEKLGYTAENVCANAKKLLG